MVAPVEPSSYGNRLFRSTDVLRDSVESVGASLELGVELLSRELGAGVEPPDQCSHESVDGFRP